MLERSSIALVAVALAAALAMTTLKMTTLKNGTGRRAGGRGKEISGFLMPAKKDQPPPDLRYFKQAQK
jgi:hypothetical protein